jgi:hypothetical protein
MRRFIVLAALMLLSACVISPLPVEKKEAPAVASPTLPAPVWPDACVADWYAKEKLPPCVESWITDITKQQKTIEKKRKIHKNKQRPRHSQPAPAPHIKEIE